MERTLFHPFPETRYVGQETPYLRAGWWRGTLAHASNHTLRRKVADMADLPESISYQRQLTDHQINEFNADHVTVTRYDDRAEFGAHHQYAVFIHGDKHPPVVVISFQKGPVKEFGVNGITDEALLAIVLDRLRGFQTTPYSCRENSLAITKLEEALHWLMHRAFARQRRGVEGTSAV